MVGEDPLDPLTEEYIGVQMVGVVGSYVDVGGLTRIMYLLVPKLE